MSDLQSNPKTKPGKTDGVDKPKRAPRTKTEQYVRLSRAIAAAAPEVIGKAVSQLDEAAFLRASMAFREEGTKRVSARNTATELLNKFYGQAS